MAGNNIKVPSTVGNCEVWTGGTSVNAADILYTTGDMTRFDTFTFVATAGVLAVFASLDNVNYEAVALQDLSAASVGATYVATLASGHIGLLQGNFVSIQVQQSGAAATANAVMLCSKKGGQF